MVFERTITTTYNDQGDKAEERTTITDNCVQPTSFDFPKQSEIRCEYQYDDHGNWTQLTVNHSSRPDAPSVVCHRKITYY
jgi:hypothetical protein